VVLAVLAAGVHTMSIAAPALAEQERLAEDAEAAAERSIVPNPAATEGLPVPALLGGIVLAFAVGLTGGQVQRRRRASRRTAVAKERPAPEPTPVLPVRPAPPPPEPVVQSPKPVALAAPAPPAPPPPPAPVRSSGSRILRFRGAPVPPPPPEPEVVEPPAREVTADEVIEEVAAAAPEPEVIEEPRFIEPPEPEVVEPRAEREIVPPPQAAAPSGPLGVAPEVPQRDSRPPLREVPPASLSDAPEALGGREPAPEPVVPARRFARARPWPEEAETLWTCEIAWKAGYLKSTFRAMAGPPGGGRRKSIGESPSLRWTLMTDPEPPTSEMLASVKALVSALIEAGWERAGAGTSWYAQRFVWRGEGEPRPVTIPDAAEAAEPPSR
jgi:hypothetical protein